MNQRIRRTIQILALGLVLLAGGATAETEPDVGTGPPSEQTSAESVLDAAFVNRYEVDLTTRIDLTIHGRSGQQRHRTLRAVTKVIDNRVHSLGRITSPEHLRGMTVMMMEAENRGHDAFLYLPSLDKVRRISTSQRGDAFFGTDVTYEDIEHQTVADFNVAEIEHGTLEGEAVYRIHARPKRRSNYERVVFTIAEKDGAMLGSAYFKRDAKEPYRVLTAPRSHMIESGGHVLPTRMRDENIMRGTYTEVALHDLRTDEKIDDRIFSIKTLESRRDLPGAN
ncbi:MAG: outer membrane lipoprotein-sorting protein [Myxococcota bacterium]